MTKRWRAAELQKATEVQATPATVAEVTGGTGGIRADAGKLPWHLLPWDAAAEIVKVLQFGASKYAERNWEKGLPYGKTFSASMRHLTDWFQHRADLDHESRIRTLAHAGCGILFLLAYELRGRTDLDDRPFTDEPIRSVLP